MAIIAPYSRRILKASPNEDISSRDEPNCTLCIQKKCFFVKSDVFTEREI